MAFTSSLYPGEVVVHDGSPTSLFMPQHGEGRGLELPPLSSPDGRRYGADAEPFPAELLVPMSEMEARIREQEERKLRVSDLINHYGLPEKDQERTNYCTTEDTEVLTENGWVGWPNYNGTDLLATVHPVTGKMEFQAPLARQVFEHDGPMVYSTNRSVDFAVTPDHRMLVRKWDERRRRLADNYTFTRAADMGWYCGLPHAPSGFVGTSLVRVRIDGDRTYDGDDFVRLVSLVVSDGYAGGTDKTRNWVSFACFNEKRQADVRALAARIGFSECPGRSGVWVRYDAAALASWFRANAYASPELGAHNKRVPGIIKQSSSRQIRLFLATYGDQSHGMNVDGGGRHYFSTSRRAVDDLQELLLRVGRRGSIWSEERAGKVATLDDGKSITSRRSMWHLHERSDDRLSIDRKRHIETERYKGLVYCATVPNSTLITRRNGSVLISGNCWIYGVVQAQEVMRLRMNQPMVRLSAASAGARIKGFRNVGGWGLEAIKHLGLHGVNEEGDWPNATIDSRYDTPESRRKALDHRVTEWWELTPRSMHELASLLLMGIPAGVGYNWWSHEVMAADPLWLDGTLALRIRNQWKGWGSNNFGVLQGSLMYPDDTVAPRQSVAA